MSFKYGYYQVSWGAITYYLRNVNKNILLKPIKNIYSNKSKFCDFYLEIYHIEMQKKDINFIIS